MRRTTATHNVRRLLELLFVKAGSAFLMLITGAIVARLLFPEDVGTYVLLLSCAALLGVVGRFGVGQAALKFVSISHIQGAGNAVRSIVITCSAVAASGSLLVSGLFLLVIVLTTVPDAYKTFSNFPLNLVLVLLASAIGLQAVIGQSLRGVGRLSFGVFVDNSLALCLVTIFLVFVWLSGRELHLPELLVVLAIAYWSALLIGSLVLSKRIASIPTKDQRGSLKPVFVFAASAYGINLVNMGLAESSVLMASCFFSGDQVAVFGNVVRLIKVVFLPLMVANIFVEAVVARQHGRGERTFESRAVRTASTLAALPSIIIVVVLFGAGEMVLRLVFGEFYGQGASVARIFAIGQLVNVLTGPCTAVLVFAGHERKAVSVTIFILIVALCASAVVGDSFGIEGIALCYATALAIGNIVLWGVTKMVTGINTAPSISLVRSAITKLSN